MYYYSKKTLTNNLALMRLLKNILSFYTWAITLVTSQLAQKVRH